MSEAVDKPSIRRRLTTSIRKVIQEALPQKPEKEKKSSKAEGKKAVVGETSAAATSIGRPKASRRPPPAQSAAERAQALFKKHGLQVDMSDWPLQTKKPQSERVQKEIRMRVHRTCHKCSTTYGADKLCTGCGHKRCKKCPRYPPKKTEKQKKEKQEREWAKVGYKKRKGDVAYGLTIPSRTGGPDRVHKQIRQRVHRKCHRCQTDFGAVKVCSNCQHNRCKKCPREPSKKNKPDGYYDKHDPSDSEVEYPAPPRRTYKRPRRRVHWVCNKCDTTFLEKTKICSGCGSNRDDTGVRDPPKKDKKKYDADVDKLGSKLAATAI